MNRINNNYQFFKSALAFFFLFFLNGISIGNGQQGITHNGICFAKWRFWNTTASI